MSPQPGVLREKGVSSILVTLCVSQQQVVTAFISDLVPEVQQT